MTKLDKFIPFLNKLGLTKYESRIIVVLFKLEKATAKELSEFTAIKITKIYQVLKELENKDFLKSNSAKPKTYTGMKVENVCRKLLEKREEYLNGFFEGVSDFVKNLTNLELEKIVTLKRIHPVLDATRLIVKNV